LNNGLSVIGEWSSLGGVAHLTEKSLPAGIAAFRSPAFVVRDGPSGRVGVGVGGGFVPDSGAAGARLNGSGYPCLGILPALYPEWLGDRAFLEQHGLRFPYVAGAMARGIASEALVIAMARAGMLGFFGAGGLSPARVEQALVTLTETLGTALPWGCNLIHSPQEPDLESRIVALFLRYQVRRVEASAFMALTPAVVRYAFHGVTRDAAGQIQRANHVFAKISRPEVAQHFMAPPPQALLDALVQSGELTADEATLARLLPVAEDVTVESDSGGHTDNRPLGSLFPTIAQLRDELVALHGFTRPIRVGAAGGLGTPESVAAAFALGAAYVLTGSVNQSCREAGVSDDAKVLLARAELADMTMAPSADMFELGVKVQVLKRGTMFASRAAALYGLYTRFPSLDAIPADELARIEQQLFRQPVGAVWDDARKFFEARAPHEIERAERDPKHKMALVFRSYLGRSSRWPIDGDADRRLDYQIWCGPAMGAFNAWVKGSFLEKPENRTVVQVALNLLEGAAYVTRAAQLRSYGVPVPAAAFVFRPRPLQ
jgi:trans-AT polyketide synthase, acyltransferase and oxidoreductase domains